MPKIFFGKDLTNGKKGVSMGTWQADAETKTQIQGVVKPQNFCGLRPFACNYPLFTSKTEVARDKQKNSGACRFFLSFRQQLRCSSQNCHYNGTLCRSRFNKTGVYCVAKNTKQIYTAKKRFRGFPRCLLKLGGG